MTANTTTSPGVAQKEARALLVSGDRTIAQGMDEIRKLREQRGRPA
jgi:hypothetical protein